MLIFNSFIKQIIIIKSIRYELSNNNQIIKY
jgi:hypothetical protein